MKRKSEKLTKEEEIEIYSVYTFGSTAGSGNPYTLDDIQERHTIKEWSEITGIIILDPDGFNRKDPNLHSNTYTHGEFIKGAMWSTIKRKIRQ